MKYKYYTREDCSDSIWRWHNKTKTMWRWYLSEKGWQPSGCSPLMFTPEMGGSEFTNFSHTMNQYTDTQLKQALAKMLPETVQFIKHPTEGFSFLQWEHKKAHHLVLDTELLHLCWLVEETLEGEYEEYSQALVSQVKKGDIAIDRDYWSPPYHATWQQRVVALAKVKGAEIV